MDDVNASWWARTGKRLTDMLLAGTALALTSPLLAASAAAVAATSPGGVFYRQQRVGREGRIFEVLKLRTMAASHRHDPTELVPLGHTAVTPVGRVLRRFKIDELPQLLNVLRGDMALVGPRPTLPEHAASYDAFQRRRLQVRPGITGLAQVNGNTELSWDERIRYDVHYVRHHDLRMDLEILLKTVAVVLRGEGAFARPFDESPYARLEAPARSRSVA